MAAPGDEPPVRLRRATTPDLDGPTRAAVRALLDRAFDGAFADDDWTHALGGIHVLAMLDGEVVAHASVVERTLWVDRAPLRTGYVEAVATAAAHRHRGVGTAVMAEVDAAIASGPAELGALSTGVVGFYRPLGWELWRGPTWALSASGRRQRTADDDGGVMVLRTPRTPPISLDDAICCDHRAGDLW